MKIPFVDLKAQYQSIKVEIDAAIENILTNTSFIGGPVVKEFESNFANYMHAAHCIGCGNGTDAIEIALEALDLAPDSEVIVPAMSWISTAECVTTAGAIPVFADILPGKHTIDPVDIERKITNKTRALIPVHFYGRSAEMDEIMAIAKKHNLKVLEDAAQAHGTEYKGQRVGTFGDISTFSFYPGKNLGAYGDAGAITTNDDMLAERCRVISNHGQVKKHHHIREGRNSRLDTLQAAILDVKLKHIESWTESRIEHAKYYNEQLADLPIELPQFDADHRLVFHVYAILVEDREGVKKKLEERGISTQIHYPKSLPELIPYQDRFDADDYPVAKKLGACGLSLPMYAELTREQQDYVIEMLKEVLV
ncbi:MAG: DegT/DnrJ/EryC1/StrS family aminotransferase [Reichenbachiella sp.]|uniref:DegT/DnrJ/EryC1/StrS family aminotransferase n=1 Tax=Reichenbachiella sp. TaxID=2184521 RepID=UPI0032668270